MTRTEADVLYLFVATVTVGTLLYLTRPDPVSVAQWVFWGALSLFAAGTSVLLTAVALSPIQRK